MSKKNDNSEVYALLTIADILKLNPNDFVVSDKPDIQNHKDSIGIEVTRAITKHQGYTINLANDFFSVRKKKQNKVFEAKKYIEEEYPNFEGNISIINGNIAAISPSKGYTFSENRLIEAKNAIIKKEENKENYKLFDKNYLYLFLYTTIFEKDEIEELLDIMIPLMSYDGIFINCIDRIYFHEIKDFSIFELSYNQLNKYNDIVKNNKSNYSPNQYN